MPYVYHLREFLYEDHNQVILNKNDFISTIKGADKVIAISETVKNKWRKEYGIESELIYNGLPVSKHYLKYNKRKFMNNSINCIMIGRIKNTKG